MRSDGEMLAAWYERQGPAREVLVVGTMRTPAPAAGEVRVRLRTSGPNPSDVKRRAGFRGMPMPFARVVPHSDGAGVIDAVGEGVAEERVGERVWLYNGGWQRPGGTAAQWIALPEALTVPLPESADDALGACLGIPAFTAHACVLGDGPVDGARVLVSGGAGSVGYFAIQLARWAGAEVIATVSSPEKAAIARRAGAEHVIDYQSQDVAAVVAELTDGKGVDRIVEVAFGMNVAADAAMIRSGGTIAAYASDADHEPRLPFYSLMQKNVTLRLCFVYLLDARQRAAATADVTAAIEAGGLQEHVARRLPLADIATAHEAIEGGRLIGNVVLEIPAA